MSGAFRLVASFHLRTRAPLAVRPNEKEVLFKIRSVSQKLSVKQGRCTSVEATRPSMLGRIFGQGRGGEGPRPYFWTAARGSSAVQDDDNGSAPLVLSKRAA